MITFVSVDYKRLTPEIIIMETVDSTNNYAAKMFREGNVQNGTLFLTKRQTSGRGQRDTTWQSDTNKNVLMSCILKEEISIDRSFYLNMISSLSVLQCLNDLGVIALIKWPNDILADGKKISGMLIENQVMGSNIQSSIIGVGLNLNQKKFDPSLNATSVINETGEEHEPRVICEQFLAYLDFYLDKLLNREFTFIREKYYHSFYGLGRTLDFLEKGKKFSAKVLEVDEQGRLKLETSEGIRQFMFKEVEFVMG